MLSVSVVLVAKCDECGKEETFCSTDMTSVLEKFKTSSWYVITPTGDRKDTYQVCSSKCRLRYAKRIRGYA